MKEEEFRGNEYLEFLRIGWSIDEVAKIFGVTKAEVKAQAYWWRRKLDQLMGQRLQAVQNEPQGFK